MLYNRIISEDKNGYSNVIIRNMNKIDYSFHLHRIINRLFIIMSSKNATNAIVETPTTGDKKKKKIVKKKIIRKELAENSVSCEIKQNMNEKCMDAYESEYITVLSEMERITYNIAKDHLGTSFNLQKSIGFIKWYENSKT